MNHKTVQLPKLNLSLLVVGTLVGLFAAIGYVASNNANRAYLPQRSEALTPPSSVDASYAYLSFEDLIGTADGVVIGRVQEIGTTQWNQESGEYWEYTLKEGGFDTTIVAQPYYEIILSVESELVALSNSEGTKQLTVVIPTLSPIDGGESIGIRVGSEVMTFVVQDEMPWFDGVVSFNKDTNAIELGETRPILTIATSPESSFLQKSDDGSFVHDDSYQETATAYTEEEVNELIRQLRE